LVDTAERDRRLREIQEAGRRQAEEKLREREDVVYNEILRVHQGTVDTYLDWIFTNTVEKGLFFYLLIDNCFIYFENTYISLDTPGNDNGKPALG
jgi:hypothetical protein